MRPLCLIASILTYLSAAGHALAEEPFFRDYGYEREAYGNHPLQVFRSTDLTVPRLNILKSSATCDDSLYTFLSPRGHATAEPLATIYDHGGHLVWASSWEGQQLYNFLAQEYKGEKYLTFWAGNDAVGGHGAGVYYMVGKVRNDDRSWLFFPSSLVADRRHSSIGITAHTRRYRQPTVLTEICMTLGLRRLALPYWSFTKSLT